MVDEPLILSRYRPLASLGVGGHGSVILAFDTKMARRVAIKRLPLPRDTFGRPVAKVGLSEARTAALLNHPNIITIYEWDTDSDEAFVVMEDVAGASLAEILDATGGPLGVDVSAAVVAQIVTALSFAHENGVLHLDLKPSNILITPDGRVKITDFGVSALTGPGGHALGIAGTIGYMPPEQIRGEKLDERTDVWALAALTYELLTNANPFDSDTPEGSLFKIEVADLPSPSEFEHSLPTALDDVLIAALAASPADRYPSVTSFSRAIGLHLGDVQTGREILVHLVEEIIGPPLAEETGFRPLGIWDRLVRYSGTARHTAAAVVSAWLGWVGVRAFSLELPVCAGAIALIGLAGLLAPGLGLALGLASIAVGTLYTAGPIPAAVFAGAAFVFWILKGRRGSGSAVIPWAVPLLGVIRAAPALPLLLGFVYPPLTAAISAGVAGLVITAFSFVIGEAPPFLTASFDAIALPWAAIAEETVDLGSLLTPGILIALATWPLSAAVCSIACRHANRTWAAAGSLGGMLIMLTGYHLWASQFGGGFTLSNLLLDAFAGLVLMAALIALGAPVRPEEETNA